LNGTLYIWYKDIDNDQIVGYISFQRDINNIFQLVSTNYKQEPDPTNEILNNLTNSVYNNVIVTDNVYYA